MNLTSSMEIFSTSKLIKLIIISVMIYQVIDMTIKYRKYPTIIKSDLKYFESGDLPSITICRKDHDWQFEGKGKEINNDRKSIVYQFLYPITGERWLIELTLILMPILQAWDNDIY